MNRFIQSVGLNDGSGKILAFFGIVAFLYLASPVVIPIALAVYFNLLLSPVVAVLCKARIPRALGSACVVLGLVSVLLGGASLLADPAQEWFEQVPMSYSSMKKNLVPMTEPLEDISELAETVDELTTLDTGKRNVTEVTVKAPNLFAQVADQMPKFLLSLAIVLFLTYFFLSSNDSFLRKIVGLGRSFSERRGILALFREIQGEVSSYVLTITLINFALGVAVAGAMFLLDVPNPFLWGSLAMLLNFIPYIGALTMVAVMLMVGIVTFSTPAAIVAPALAYAGLSVLEGNLVTPTLLGKRLALQPSVVFISVVFWGWMWGVVGAALSIPIMVALKTVLDKLPDYRFLSVMLQR